MKHLRRKLLLPVWAVGAWIGAMAGDVGYVLNINLTDGRTEKYRVADHPVVSFDAEYVTVTSKNFVANYVTGEVADYTFTTDNGIMGDVNDDGAVTIEDITITIDVYLSEDYSGINISHADFDFDGTISVSDITALIDTYLEAESKRRALAGDLPVEPLEYEP